MSNESSIFRRLSGSEKQLKEMYNAILQGDLYDKSEKFLLQLMTTKIDQIESKSRKSKSIRNILKIAVLSLSGLATILLGINQVILTEDFLKDIVLIITALVTFLSALAVFWDIDNYWVRVKVMLNRLKALRYKYAFFLHQKVDTEVNKQMGEDTKKNKDISDDYMIKFLDIIEDEYWEKLMNSRLDSGKDDTPSHNFESEVG